jgi:hypothetical protein
VLQKTLHQRIAASGNVMTSKWNAVILAAPLFAAALAWSSGTRPDYSCRTRSFQRQHCPSKLPSIRHLYLVPATLQLSSQRTASFLDARKPSWTGDEKSEVGRERHNGNDTRPLVLEYSPNFRRHIVREKKQSTDGQQHLRVLQSFAWLDEALRAFASVECLPLQPSCWSGETLTIAGGGGIVVSAALEEQDDRSSTNNNSVKTYPILVDVPYENRAAMEAENTRAIRDYLYSTLGWSDSRIDTLLFDACPHLRQWPVAILTERLDFLLAPLPDDPQVVAHMNASDVVDWPVEYYNNGRGAGLTVAQVSHALSAVPMLFFRDLEQLTTANTTCAAPPSLLKYLYEETPSVVLDLAGTQLDALYGASTFDAIAYSYLHWKGWEFHQIRVLLQGLPGCLACSVEPGRRVFARRMRKELRLDSLVYLQHRLQIGPSHLQAMLKTHASLSCYPVSQLVRNCDALQRLLPLSSNGLRSLVLRMPSLLGMSVQGMEDRIDFWTRSVGLTVQELEHCVGLLPALLQYSRKNNLEPKLRFWAEDLGRSHSEIRKITLSHPKLWGRSLQGQLRPLADAFCTRCGNLTMEELGYVLYRAPELARFNWKYNLEPKLDYLEDRLSLSPVELQTLVVQTPRILAKSLGSFYPRVALLEEVSSLDECREAILAIPSLLQIPYATLQRRLEGVRVSLASSPRVSLLASLQQTSRVRKQSKKTVCLLSTDGMVVEKRFASVEEAARHASVSRSNMYVILSQGRRVKERQYVLVDAEKERLPGLRESGAQWVTPAEKNGQSTPGVPSLVRDMAQGVCADHAEELSKEIKLTIYVSGRAFPPEDALRGRRRAGGMAFQVPTWTSNDWKVVVSQLWRGQHFRLLNDGRTLLLGYPYTRPSRSRCSLYACREALRAIRAWIPEQPLLRSKSSDGPRLHIEIVTDSNA